MILVNLKRFIKIKTWQKIKILNFRTWTGSEIWKEAKNIEFRKFDSFSSTLINLSQINFDSFWKGKRKSIENSSRYFLKILLKIYRSEFILFLYLILDSFYKDFWKYIEWNSLYLIYEFSIVFQIYLDRFRFFKEKLSMVFQKGWFKFWFLNNSIVFQNLSKKIDLFTPTRKPSIVLFKTIEPEKTILPLSVSNVYNIALSSFLFSFTDLRKSFSFICLQRDTQKQEHIR